MGRAAPMSVIVLAIMRHTKWVKAVVVVRSTLVRGTAAAAAALLVLGIVGLAACGGGGDKDRSTASADQAAQQAEAAAEAERQLQARRQQLEQAEEAVSRIRTEADTAVPVKDEALGRLVADLEQATSAAGSQLEGDGAAAALERVSALEKQATERLAELRAQEQAARSELHALYAEAVEKAPQVQPDLVRGFDGELYLGYLPSAVEHAQRELKAGGFYGGPVTGVLDEDTRVAIARFQQLNGQLVTGIPTPYTRAALYQKESE